MLHGSREAVPSGRLRRQDETCALLVGNWQTSACWTPNRESGTKTAWANLYSGVSAPMPKGYRHIVITVAGLLLCGTAQPNEQRTNAQNSGQLQPTFAPIPDNTPYPDKYADSCYNAKSHDSADLCAQWRAAIAAEKAVNSAWWGNVIGGVGAALSIISLAFVLVALKQTEKSLAAAREANLIARESDRPWLKIEVSPTLRYDDGGGTGTQPQIEHTVTATNIGGSPALDVSVSYSIVTGTMFQVDDEHARLVQSQKARRTFGRTILQGNASTFGENLLRGVIPQRTIHESSSVGRADVQVIECDYVGIIVQYRSVHQSKRSYYVAAFFHVGGNLLPKPKGVARLIEVAGEYHGEVTDD